MAFCDGVPKRLIATSIALVFAMCVLGTFAAAQLTVQPRAEVYGGYSWYDPNGYVDWGKVPSIAHGWDVSGTFYLPNVRKLGVVIDGSGHYNSNFSNAGFGLAGLQYKFRTEQFSPFVRVLVGAAKLSPAGLDSQWRAAVGGGGGFDLTLTNLISIRIAQADYLYTTYNPQTFTSHTTTWNSIRLSAGVVFNLGNYYTAPLSATCTATPSTVIQGEPVTVTASPVNFDPKHTLTYAWTIAEGKLSSPSTATTTVDTTGLSDGTHTANVTITDPKGPKLHNVANCGANFNVNVPHNPPQVTCQANPTTVKSGETSTITANAVSPDKAEITGYSFSSSAGKVTGSGNTATLDTTGLPGSTVNVTVTATDSRGLTGSCTTQVGVIAEIKCVNIEDWGECTFEKNPKKPWRVDNDCKDTLDKLALRLQQMPSGKLVIVGYTDEKETVDVQQLGAQRSVNVKYYLTTDGPTKSDASRIEPREGGTKGKATHFYLVPEGALCSGQAVEGTPVDETKVQPQSRNAPAPKKHKAKAKPAAPPAQ